MKWWNEKIIMPVCGQNKSMRKRCNVLRPVYAARKHLIGQNPDDTRKFLALTRAQYNDYLFGFSKVTHLIKKDKNFELLANFKEYPLELLK